VGMKFLILCLLALLSLSGKVIFQLKGGSVTLNYERAWCPNGVDRFLELVDSGYYNKNGVFRVVPSFVVQFGISGNTTQSGYWRSRNIQDDPVVKSNLRGWVSYAATSARHSRTTQLFINLVNNTRLDGMGFSPFAFISEADMKIVDKIYSGYGQQPNQNSIYSQGNAYLEKNFPLLDYLIKATRS